MPPECSLVEVEGHVSWVAHDEDMSLQTNHPRGYVGVAPRNPTRYR